MTDGPETRKFRAVGVMLLAVCASGIVAAAMIAAVLRLATR